MPFNPYLSQPALARGWATPAVWDWDITNAVAVVPDQIKIATIYQADAIQRGEIAAKLDRLGKGLTSLTTGPASETYGNSASANDPASVLTQSALAIVSRYRLRTGRIL
jgi:hypothetical protein